MNRSMNLDLVAPDDPVVEPKKEVKKEVNKEIKKIGVEEVRVKVNGILGHTKHSFSSFLVNPSVFSFNEREDKEEILLVLRRHWFTNVSWIVIAGGMLVLPTFLKFVPLLNSFPVNFQIIFVMFWYMITFAFTLEKFLSWYFNVCIVTDERVIDIDFNNLLEKKFSDAKISMIQDVTSRVAGVSQTLFNYGTVLIQTASEVNELVFEKVPNPDKVVKVLQLMRQEEEQEAIEGRIR